MSRWGHGHSAALGALTMLALIRGEYLWALTAAFLAGLLVGRAWGWISSLLRRGLGELPVIEGRWRRSG